MNNPIPDDLLEEGTKLLEEWARKRDLLPQGTQLLVSMNIVGPAPVTLKIEDRRSLKELDEVLSRPVDKLKLSTRPQRGVRDGGFPIYIIGDLARHNESQLLKLRGFGKKSLLEVKCKLEEIALKLDTDIPVGPLEREAVLNMPFYGYVWRGAARLFEAAGMMSVKDLISKTEDEIVAILKDSDPKEIGKPQEIYYHMRESFKLRGLLA